MKARDPYRKSNLVMVGIVGCSILASGIMTVALRLTGGIGGRSDADVKGDHVLDEAVYREN